MQLADEKSNSLSLAGERRGWDSIYRTFAGRLLARAQAALGGKLGRVVDAQDVVQSAFRTLIRRSRSGEVGPAQDAELWRLLLAVTLNKIRKVATFHRAAKRSIDQTVALPRDRAVADCRGEELDALINRITLEEQLDRVRPEQRRILELFLGGMSVQEVAETTNRAPRTIYRAVAAFQDSIARLLDESKL